MDVITCACPRFMFVWFISIKTQIAKFMGPTWGPPGSCRSQMGPMLAPRTLLSRKGPLAWENLPTWLPQAHGNPLAESGTVGGGFIMGKFPPPDHGTWDGQKTSNQVLVLSDNESFWASQCYHWRKGNQSTMMIQGNESQYVSIAVSF